jgi:hypothetical protein
MAEKEKSKDSQGAEASRVVRQFAWNIAGSLASAKAGNAAVRPAKPSGKR